MSIFSIPPMVMAGIALYVGVYPRCSANDGGPVGDRD